MTEATGTNSPIIQLPAQSAAAYMKQMYGQSKSFKALMDSFTQKGFQFYFERSKVFCYAGRVVRTGEAPCDPLMDRGVFGVSANLMGILPSFIEARPCDESHTAIGIAVHQSGAAVATSVTVSHNPFQVVSFTLHEVAADGGIRESHVTTSELARLSTDEVAAKLGHLRVAETDIPPHSAPLSDEQVRTFISSSLEQILADPFASPLYRPEGPRSLLAQLPLIQKFAMANRARFQYEASFSLCLATSSTCCNGCTTSSVIINTGSLTAAT